MEKPRQEQGEPSPGEGAGAGPLAQAAAAVERARAEAEGAKAPGSEWTPPGSLCGWPFAKLRRRWARPPDAGTLSRCDLISSDAVAGDREELPLP
jgi:hypothetical protein